MSTFQEKLKAIYKRSNKIAPLIEGLESEIPQQTLDEYYVKLKTIIKEDDEKKQSNYETISGQKKEVEIEEIFDHLSGQTSTNHHLLILGGAGVGKSTLMQYMAYRWSQGGLWKDRFDYVYRVSLKTLLNRDWSSDYNKEDDMLKCLAHYHLVAELTNQERKDCKLEEMAWLGNQNKILLLLDGYDEVAHERKGVYKRVFDAIFEHKNIILTSRPNAIDKEMTEKFTRKIENTGLDHDGINQYLTRYFQEDSEKCTTLKEFLEKNSSIKDICRIPVNLAMMCFIWSEGESNESLRKISNMSDLYHQVVDQLGFRYFAKQENNVNLQELVSKWRGGEIYLDELQVLQHSAYKGMTGGGIEIPDDQRFETLILKGMTKKGDKEGISIQSSINYLRDRLKKEIPTINKVYKYGLLKPEGIMTEVARKKEPSETDLQAQSFSFIHLSFQEFLTALYLASSLLQENNENEQEKIANFIANHRNEPRYLMTLKLMAGILSASEEKQASQAIKIFWDAVLCNPDGVLELGIEAKVSLLMHLFSQTKKEGQIDDRIPNLKKVVSLIDSVVLNDLSEWSTQLKESDYTSDCLKEALIEYFFNDNQSWISKKSEELQNKNDLKLKMEVKNENISLRNMIQILDVMINRFSREERLKLFVKLAHLISNLKNSEWQVTSRIIEILITIHEKVKLETEKEDMTNAEREVLHSLLAKVSNSNLQEISSKIIKEMINVTELKEQVKNYVKEGLQENLNFEIVCAKAHLSRMINDYEFAEDIVAALSCLLRDSKPQERALASNHIIELAQMNGNSQFQRTAILALIPFLESKDLQMIQIVSETILKIYKISNRSENIPLLKDAIAILTPFLNIENLQEVSQNIIALAKVTDDVQFIKDVINGISKLDRENATYEGKEISRAIAELAKFGCNYDSQFARDIINMILTTPLIHNKFYNRDNCKAASKIAIESDSTLAREIVSTFSLLFTPRADFFILIVACSNIQDIVCNRGNADPQLANEVMTNLAELLSNSNVDIRNRVSSLFEELVKRRSKSDVQLAANAVDFMVPLLQNNNDPEIRKLGLERILSLVKNGFNGNTQLARDTIQTFAPLLKDSSSSIKERAFKSIVELGKISGRNDLQLVQEGLAALTPFLYDSALSIPDYVFQGITELLEIGGNSSNNMQIMKDVISILISLFKSVAWKLPQYSKNIFTLINVNRNPLVVRDTATAFISILQTAEYAHREVPQIVPKIVQLTVKEDPQFVQDIITTLTQLFKVSELKLKAACSKTLMNLAKVDNKFDTQLIKDVMVDLMPVLLSSDWNQYFDSTDFVELARLSRGQYPQLINDIIVDLISLLQKDTSYWSRDKCFTNIIGLLKVTETIDPAVLKDMISILPLFFEKCHEAQKTTEKMRDLTVIAKRNPQLIRRLIDILIPLLDNQEFTINSTASSEIISLVSFTGTTTDIQLPYDIIATLTPLTKDPDFDKSSRVSHIISEIVKLKAKTDPKLVKETIDLFIPGLQDSERVRETSLHNIMKLAKESTDKDHLRDVFMALTPLMKNSLIDKIKGMDSLYILAQKNTQLIEDAIAMIIPFLADSEYRKVHIASDSITQLAKLSGSKTICQGVIHAVTPLLNDMKQTNPMTRIYACQNIALLAKVDDDESLKSAIESLPPLLKDPNSHLRESVSTQIADLVKFVLKKEDSQIAKETLTNLIPPLQHYALNGGKEASALLEIISQSLLTNSNILFYCFNHPLKELRSLSTSALLTSLKTYLQDFQVLDELFQTSTTQTQEMVSQKLFKTKSLPAHLKKMFETNQDKKKIKLALAVELNQIGGLKGSQIIELALTIIGKEKGSEDGSNRQKLIELGRETLSIQLKHLTEAELIWISKNHNKLISLSPETKLFYKKIYHTLLEDGQITPLEEELIGKFISQGLTTSVTRTGEIVFEGKRYKLQGEDIVLALEKIAKTIITQQQDLLAEQYKNNEPIFKKVCNGGMREAAADKKTISSIVDSRQRLTSDSWLLTQLKSLKFNSEIILLETRNAFGDHLIYHFNEQKLFRFYPNELPALEEIFGSYIYGEVYQGQVIKLTDKVGQNLFESKAKKLPKVEGKPLSRQVFFQQELLRKGNEDRNSAIEEELAKKLDNNRAVLEAKLKSFNLEDSEKEKITEYYEGFVSTFSSAYTSSQAIESGKLSIDDGEDFFSPVSLFIKLSSLAPFGIGDVLSEGLEAARSYIKGNEIKNEAVFVKEIAVDAVELSTIVNQVVLEVISKKEERKRIIEEKDEEQNNLSLIQKIKNLINEKLEKLKLLAEKYSKIKNLSEKEIETSPAFRLGESDANKILEEWISFKHSNQDVRLNLQEKQKRFLKIIIADEPNQPPSGGGSAKITPEDIKSPLKRKGGCCEIF